ncbi:hypothetical protein P691DRAFT_760656 [Macrolepiota fuliginosa MF-IS2]|uniref:Uncharacterized protein n=1 Tax=Macrolepiota fuliginosa MF-IS2 TaxID=1400762 RepID=A0A9P5XA21_9AGAR|nr:hypothetical protein P691DRAFT_760656 [Macrolepiota fuliginosa MF-IS2]
MPTNNANASSSLPLNSSHETRSRDKCFESTATETTRHPAGRARHNLKDYMPPQSSSDYPTNPTTERRYGTEMGTGFYGLSNHHAGKTGYTIKETDFKLTGPDSGKGIHARQWSDRGWEDSIPVGPVTYIRSTDNTVEPTHVRTFESDTERYTPRGVGGRGKQNHEKELGRGAESVLVGEELCGPQIVEERRRGSQLQHDRQQALLSEQQRVESGKIDTTRGSVHGLYGHGRHRDAAIVGRDTDATDFGSHTSGRVDAHRDRLSTTGSEQDRMVGTAEGRERFAKEQDARISSVRATQRAADHHAGVTDFATSGTDVRITEPKQEMPVKGKPSMMDKAIGKTEIAIGKATGNANMTAKGEAKEIGLSRN